jgi:hypothetical protein
MLQIAEHMADVVVVNTSLVVAEVAQLDHDEAEVETAGHHGPDQFPSDERNSWGVQGSRVQSLKKELMRYRGAGVLQMYRSWVQGGRHGHEQSHHPCVGS